MGFLILPPSHPALDSPSACFIDRAAFRVSSFYFFFFTACRVFSVSSFSTLFSPFSSFHFGLVVIACLVLHITRVLVFPNLNPVMTDRYGEDERRHCVYGSAFLSLSRVVLLGYWQQQKLTYTLAGHNSKRSSLVVKSLTTPSRLASTFFVSPEKVRTNVRALVVSRTLKTVLLARP